MLRTAFAWALGTPNTALWGTLSLLGSLVDGSGRWAHQCMVRWARINLWLTGTRVDVTGDEHIRLDAGQVLAANHQSMADILVLAAVLPVPFRFVAKRELFDLPFIGWHMRRAGFIPIERARPREAARTLLESSERIRSGVNALVFPEGTRSSDGQLLPFRHGAFMLAIRSGAAIVPIAIDGTAAIVRKGELGIRRATARVTILPPIDPNQFDGDRAAIALATQHAIAQVIDQPLEGDSTASADSISQPAEG